MKNLPPLTNHSIQILKERVAYEETRVPITLVLDVTLLNDGAGGLSLNTINGVCLKSYNYPQEFNRAISDINSLRRDDSIDL